jgi:uncharacterized protein (TIGR00255 family)
MSGYGRGEYRSRNFHWIVELKAINHRYLAIDISLPPQFFLLEPWIRECIKKVARRGHINVVVAFRSLKEEYKIKVDKALARRIYSKMKTLGEFLDLEQGVTLEKILEFPGVFTLEKKEFKIRNYWPSLKSALEQALASLVKMREREGKYLYKEFSKGIEIIRRAIKKIDQKHQNYLSNLRNTVKEKIKKLSALDLEEEDKTRFEKEVAYGALHENIQEELTRLESHCRHFTEILYSPQKTKGKRLDFLLQEMLREINTVGTKSSSLDITQNIILVKNIIEELREQAQNIE